MLIKKQKAVKVTVEGETLPAVVRSESAPPATSRPVPDLMVSPLTDPAQFEIAIEREKKIRSLLQKYIDDVLIKDVDYGPIHVVKDCPNRYGGCKIPGHFSKDVIRKSGAEKVCSLFHLRPVFKKDEEVIAMLGGVPGLVALKCDLVDPSSNVVAEGRGACTIEEHKGSVNKAIKICEKRAQVDATLRLGYGISSSFTQDEDEIKKEWERLDELLNAAVAKLAWDEKRFTAWVKSETGGFAWAKCANDVKQSLIEKLEAMANRAEEANTPEAKEVDAEIDKAIKALGLDKGSRLQEYIEAGTSGQRSTLDELSLSAKKKMLEAMKQRIARKTKTDEKK